MTLPINRLDSAKMPGRCIFCTESEECYTTLKKCREFDKKKEEKTIQPCFGTEYESDSFFCERCENKKECWVKQETGSIPEVLP